MPGSRDQPDALLTLDRYAIGCGWGWSSFTWRIIDADRRDAIAAERAKDPWRSTLMFSMLVVALFGSGAFAGVGLALGRLSSALMLAFLACFIMVIVLAPIVALRRQMPVVLRRASDGVSLLEIDQRNRFAIARIVYDVRIAGGPLLGSVVHTPLLEPFGNSWRVEPATGRPIRLVEPSAIGAIGRRTVDKSLLVRSLRGLILVLRRAPRSSASLLAVEDGSPEPMATCSEDPTSEDWTWIQREAPAGPAAAALVVGAILLAIEKRAR